MHWADGGDTTLDNLTLLCRKHHRYLHECVELHGVHAQDGFAINEDTAVCKWSGERAQYDGLVALLQERSGVEPNVATRRPPCGANRIRAEQEDEARFAAEGEQMRREINETTARMQLTASMEAQHVHRDGFQTCQWP